MAKEKSIITTSEGSTAPVCSLRMPDGRFLALIDTQFVASVTLYRWHACGKYVARTFMRDGKQQLELLQRHIAAAAGLDIQGAVVKFVNKNPRDCRLENLVVKHKQSTKFSSPDAATAAESADDRQLDLFQA